MQSLEQEVAQLQAANAELLIDKQEALPLLEAYRQVQPHLAVAHCSHHGLACMLICFTTPCQLRTSKACKPLETVTGDAQHDITRASHALLSHC